MGWHYKKGGLKSKQKGLRSFSDTVLPKPVIKKGCPAETGQPE
jgi:hypothetical protein